MLLSVMLGALLALLSAIGAMHPPTTVLAPHMSQVVLSLRAVLGTSECMTVAHKIHIQVTAHQVLLDLRQIVDASSQTLGEIACFILLIRVPNVRVHYSSHDLMNIAPNSHQWRLLLIVSEYARLPSEDVNLKLIFEVLHFNNNEFIERFLRAATLSVTASQKFVLHKALQLMMNAAIFRRIEVNYVQLLHFATTKNLPYAFATAWFFSAIEKRFDLVKHVVLPTMLDKYVPATFIRATVSLLNKFSTAELKKELVVDGLVIPLLQLAKSNNAQVRDVALEKAKIVAVYWDPRFPEVNEYILDMCLASQRIDLVDILMDSIDQQLPNFRAMQVKFDAYTASGRLMSKGIFPYLSQRKQWEILSNSHKPARFKLLQHLFMRNGQLEIKSIRALVNHLEPAAGLSEYFDMLLEFMKTLPNDSEDISAEIRELEMLKRGETLPDVEPIGPDSFTDNDEAEWKHRVDQIF